MIVLWVLLALALTGLWLLGLLLTAVISMDDTSVGTRVAQAVCLVVISTMFALPAAFAWHYVAGFHR